jgi:phosphoribosylglycinamide formyltransferase-1
LAGFLWKVPDELIRAFPNKIINVHPALLPKFGGKGMYGMHVHEAVVNAKERESGITIHFVNEVYDDGEIIFQEKVAVLPTDQPQDVAAKIHELEYKYFPKVIDQLLFA